MNSRSRICRSSALALTIAALFAAALFAMTSSVWAEVLLIDRVEARATGTMPARGLSMAEVEERFGAPGQKLEPRGGQKTQWPTINRWVYPQFTVYFERGRVINAVLNQATPNEIGPKPAIL